MCIKNLQCNKNKWIKYKKWATIYKKNVYICFFLRLFFELELLEFWLIVEIFFERIPNIAIRLTNNYYLLMIFCSLAIFLWLCAAAPWTRHQRRFQGALMYFLHNMWHELYYLCRQKAIQKHWLVVERGANKLYAARYSPKSKYCSRQKVRRPPKLMS